MRIKIKMKKIIILLLTIAVVGCGTTPKPIGVVSETNSTKKLLVKNYLIGVDDEVQVNVWKHPDLSITVPVRPDGKISVPLIGEVLAGGRTPNDVAGEITTRLSEYIKQPNVAVILVGLRSHEYLSRVRVTGAVRSPMSLTYRQGMTILDVILAAGGLNDFASANGTKLFRKVDGNLQSIDIDLEDIFEDGDMRTNYAMEPGDIISVPERTF